MRYMMTFLLALLPLSPVLAGTLKIGDTAPDWTLKDKDGKTVEYYKDSKDRVSVILFWASGSPYCATLMPHLEVIYRKYRSKGLKFYAIDAFEDGKRDPVALFEEKDFSYTMLLDGDLVAEEWGVKATPGVYIIDKDKKVIYKRPTGVPDILVKQNMDLKIKQALSR